jgi:hypothetical protein
MTRSISITDQGGTPDWVFLVEQLTLPIVGLLCISAVALWAIKVTR